MKLNWTKELEIEVTFANGTKEKIHLKAVADLNGEEIPCLYTGSLDHDAEDSAVTVDGCQGDPQVFLLMLKRKGTRLQSYIMVFMLMIMIMNMGSFLQVIVEIASWKEVGGLLVLVIQGGQTFQFEEDTA